MTCFGKGLIDELARVDHCHFKDGWASHDLHKRAGIEIGTLTREVDRLRQLLSEAEKREREARAKALEEAVSVADDEYKRHCTGSGFDSQPARSTAHRILEALKALQSEER